MAIRIIKDGIKDWETKYRAVCRRCNCIFECLKNDGVYEPPHIRGEGDFVMIACPNCHNSCYAYPNGKSNE